MKRLTFLSTTMIATFVTLWVTALSGPALAGFVANLQFVSYCEDNGSQCAAVRLDTPVFNATWAQADITFNILPTITINQSSIAANTDMFAALSGHTANVLGPLGGPNPSTLYLGVAREGPGLPIGVTIIGSPFSIVDGSFGTDLFQTWNISHEIGHMLGLTNNGNGNPFSATAGLMAAVANPSSFDFTIFPPQVTDLQQSPLLQEITEIPEPGAPLFLSLSAFGLFLCRRRRRTHA